MSASNRIQNTTDMETEEYDIYQFLNDHRVEKGQPLTHSSMGQGKYAGSFYIRNSELDMFYDLYEKAIFEDKPLFLIEKHEEIGPIVIDFDFRFEYDVMERLFTPEHVERIVELYHNEICDLFHIDKNDDRLVAFTFQRSKCYKSKGITKDGIHIMYPFIVSEPDVQLYLRSNILKKIGPILSDLPVKNSLPDIVDKSIIYSNGWMMFFSRKPGCEPYNLTSIFDGNMNNIPIENYNYRTNDLTRFFSIRNKHRDEMIPVREDKMEIIQKLNLKKRTTSTSNTGVGTNRPRTNINYDLAQITEMVNILDVSRADNYTTWIEVGWALHNIDSELLDLWILFSRKSEKFVDGECERHWDKMKNEGLGIGSLYHWAKIDNYDKYKEIMDRDTNQLLNKTVESITNWDIANVLYKIYRYEFKYSCGEWYIFKNHLWQPMKEAMELRQKISTELVNKYMRLISDYNRIGASDDPDISEEEKEEYKKKGKKVMEIIKNLKMTSFKENLLKECKELFNDSKFLEKLDSNPYLIGFNNGIYDLQKMELRDGRPDDYVSLSTGIDKIDFTTEHEYWEPLNIFLSSTIVDNEVRNYFLTYLATCLQGVNVEQKFRVWTGSGGNGKSIINKLFQLSYGAYCNCLSVSLLTEKRAKSNAPTPEIVQTKGKRYCYLEEPNEGEKINVGIMKNYSGSDRIKGRGLNKDPIEFVPQFKLALLCNDIPQFPGLDGGVWRRVEIVEFKSKFVENPREENEFKIDPHLEDNLPLWAELFMALLIDRYYANYKLYGIHVPLEVQKYTLEFQKQSDNYHEFISQALEETKDKTDIVNVAELYDEFRVWYAEEFSEQKPPSRVEFKKYLKKKYKDNVISGGKEVKGTRFRTDFERKTDQQINISSPGVMNNVIGAGSSMRSAFSS